MVKLKPRTKKNPDVRVGIIAPTDGTEYIFTPGRGFKHRIIGPSSSPDAKDLDLVVFCGGADVSPGLYGQEKHKKTRNDQKRDDYETMLVKKYADLPKIGICRGAQFLCAVHGGSLYQDMGAHGNCQHEVHDRITGQFVRVTSDHHQACIVLPEWEVIAESALFATYAEEMVGSITRILGTIPVTEAFYIPYDGSLCVQFHPEWNLASCETYFFELYERYIACVE